jgi:EAL domain-containing protein (putative c-di-GMP-specific phosphodiesterase class I)
VPDLSYSKYVQECSAYTAVVMAGGQRRPIAGRTRAEIERLLSVVGTQLDVEVVYLTRVTDEHQVIEVVSGDPTPFGLGVGAAFPLDRTYCARMLAGDLAHLVTDTGADPVTSALPVTAEVGVGAYVGIPVRHRDGRLHGTVCCLSRERRADLTWREVRFVRAVAGLIADELADADGVDRAEGPDLPLLVAEGELSVHFQPIVRLADDRVVGVAASLRYLDGSSPLPPRGPAARNGDRAIEHLVLEASRDALDELPEPLFVTVPLSPATLLETTVDELLGRAPPRRVVFAVSELAEIHRYGDVRAALEPALDRGVRLAVDDVGSSFGGLHHVHELSPDLVTIDVGLIRGILDDENQRAVTEAIVTLAGRIDATVIAAGIETDEVRADVVALGAALGRGHLLGRPVPLSHLTGADRGR